MTNLQPTVVIIKDALGFLSLGEQKKKIQAHEPKYCCSEMQILTLARESDWEMDDVLDFLESTKAKKLLIWNLVALSPIIFDAEDLLTLLAMLEKKSVELVIVEKDFLLSSRAGVSFAEIKNLWNGFKLGRKRENALASFAKAESKGTPVRRKRKSDPSEVLALKQQGKSAQEIAAAVRVSVSSVHKILRNAKLIGGKKSEMPQKDLR